MVVHISGVASSVSRLRVGDCDLLILQALSNHEPVVWLVLVVIIVLEVARSSHTLRPLGLLGPEDVLVDFILNHRLDSLRLLLHVTLVEERMLRRIVQLSVFDAANLLSRSQEVGVGFALLQVRSHYILASAGEQRLAASVLQVLVFFFLQGG